jgi:hypothetical protein
MLILVLCTLALLSPMLFGGSMARLGLVRFRAWWVLLSALLAQILIIELFPDGDRAVLEAAHIATYVAAGVFVARNWRIPGLLLIAAGGAMNGVTIALNGGQLPASPDALRMAGIEPPSGDFVNSGALADPVLALLGDVFVWPEPFPFANVFSIGDVLIVVGAFYGAQKITGSRLVKTPWRSRDEEPVEEEPVEAGAAVERPVREPESAAGETADDRSEHGCDDPGVPQLQP